jgi:hypothetical protein
MLHLVGEKDGMSGRPGGGDFSWFNFSGIGALLKISSFKNI